MGNKRSFQINQIVKYSQKLDQKGFGANHDGNISVKFADILLATPTAVSKSDIVPEIIITLDMQGNKIEGVGKPFSEIKLHLAAYRAREDIKAVVHAHPPFATARGLLDLAIKPALPEAIVSIGDNIPVVAFAMPGAPENDTIIASTLAEYNVFMLPGNGVLSVGDSVEQAYLRLELVEHLARIDYYARMQGAPNELSAENVTKLLEKRVAAGLDPKAKTVTNLATANSRTIDNVLIEQITKIILEKIK
jgi:L-fuculose-phosphate aldolase